MRLLIVETPMLSARLIKENIVPVDTEIVCTFGVGLWRFKLPNISFPDIPFTEYPSHLRPQSFKLNNPFFYTNGESVIPIESEPLSSMADNLLERVVSHIQSNLSNYVEIICAVSPDRTGFGSAMQLLDKIGFSNHPPVHCLKLVKTDHESLLSAWSNRYSYLWKEGSSPALLATQQQVKKTFDYWWNANASIVLSELCKWSGLKADPIVSKYELMLLCIMFEKQEPLSGNDIVKMLDRWTGTGKYEGLDKVGIGSPASRTKILDNAIARGALIVQGKESNRPFGDLYTLSTAGLDFVRMLHARTFDPDLPFRLEKWIVSGEYQSMARYIKTVFGRQLRHQRNSRKIEN